MDLQRDIALCSVLITNGDALLGFQCGSIQLRLRIYQKGSFFLRASKKSTRDDYLLVRDISNYARKKLRPRRLLRWRAVRGQLRRLGRKAGADEQSTPGCSNNAKPNELNGHDCTCVA